VPSVPTKKQYRYVGNHATELEVGDTRPWIGEGDFIELSSEDLENENTKSMIDTGVLVDVSQIEAQAVAEAEAATTEAETTQEGAEEATATTTGTTKGGK
jgi:hypothetical protein